MAAADGSIPFDEPFDVQVARARARGVLLPDAFYALKPEKRALAFTVSGLARLDQVQAVADSLVRAQAEGWSFARWKAWAQEQDWSLPRHRLETIFRTNLQTNYMAGHWRHFEMNRHRRPWLMFDAINDSRVRPNHLALDGVIRHIDDPVWDRISPPLGFGCRCTTRALTDRAARRRGGRTESVPAEGHADGPGWGKRPKRLLERLGGVVAERARRCEAGSLSSDPTGRPIWCSEARAGELLSLLMAYTQPDEETVRRAVETTLFRDFVHGAPGTPDLWPIAALSEDLMELLGVRNRIVWLSRQTLDVHLRRHPEIGADEYALIPAIIGSADIWAAQRERHYFFVKGAYRLTVKVERSQEWGWAVSLFRTGGRKLVPPYAKLIRRFG